MVNSQNLAGKRTPDGRAASVLTEHSERIKRLIAGMGLAEQCEDILHDVYVAVMTRPGEYRSDEHAKHWLMRVTINRCLDEFRRRRRFERSTEEILRRRAESQALRKTPGEEAIAAEELQAVRTSMGHMDAELLAPLSLRYFEGLNATEIGQILQLNPSTVRSRLRQGRLALADSLMRMGIRP